MKTSYSSLYKKNFNPNQKSPLNSNDYDLYNEFGGLNAKQEKNPRRRIQKDQARNVRLKKLNQGDGGSDERSLLNSNS